MNEILIGVISAILGTFGFCLMFKCDAKNIPLAVAGGGVVWFVYMMVNKIVPGVFFPSFAAALVGAFYSETMANIRKTPSTVFNIPVIIPLVPGGSLYYTLSCIIFEERDELWGYAKDTLSAMLGISMGLAAVYMTVNGIRNERKNKI